MRVRWLVTDKVLLEVDPPAAPENAQDQHPRINAILTPGAERLVTVTCYNGPTLVTSYDLATGEQGPTTLIESNFSCDWGSKGMTVVPTPDAEHVLLAGTRGGVLHHVDLVDGKHSMVQAVGNVSELGLGNTIASNLIYDIAVHPGGQWAMVSTSEELIRFWTLPDLVESGAPLETTIEGVNENTYMPFYVSPLAFSPQGDLIAHVTREGEVVLRDTKTFEILVAIDRPELPEPTGSGHTFLLNNSVLRFAFERNSSAIAVLYAAGPALYGCVDWTIDGEPHDLGVLLDGPSKVKLGEEVEFVATHLGTDHVHGHQFLVNNIVMTDLSMERSFSWTPKRAGTFEVTVLLGADAPHKDQVAALLKMVDGSLLINCDEIAPTMAKADLILGAGGMGSWERCCLSKPSIMVVNADNQKANAQALASVGAAQIIEASNDINKIGSAISSLLNNKKTLMKMAVNAGRLCDGLGSSRLALAIEKTARKKSAKPVCLRPALESDAAMMLDWQRHPITRKFARNATRPTFQKHLAWLTDKLADPWCIFNIITYGNKPVGVLRFDYLVEKGGFEVSILVASAFQNLGIASHALAQAPILFSDWDLYAYINSANETSIKLFRRAGYLHTSDPGWHLLPKMACSY